MHRIAIMVMLLAMSVLTSCRPYGRIVTHVLSPRYMQRNTDPITMCHFADLKGSGRDLRITVETENGMDRILRASDHDGKTIFRFDTARHIRSLGSLAEIPDGSIWLFYTSRDQGSVSLSAIQFDWHVPENKRIREFASIALAPGPERTEARDGETIFYPVKLADFDGDGRKELLCHLSSSQTDGPRGLLMFDFSTGSKKWMLETGGNLNDVLIRDFDGDGIDEIAFASSVEPESASDSKLLGKSGGWLAVANLKGEILYSEKQFDGSGEVHLAETTSSNLDTPLLYAIVNTWGSSRIMNSVKSLIWTGSMFVSNREFYTQNSFERHNGRPNLAIFPVDGNPRLVLIERGIGLVALDYELERIKHSFNDFVSEILGWEDIDQDGIVELLVRTPDKTALILDAHLNKLAVLKDPFPNAEKVTISFVGRGAGISSGLVLCAGNQIIYYGYYGIAWYTFVWRFIEAHTIYLVVILALLVVMLIWYLIYNWQSIYTIMPDLRAAVLYLKNDDRLMYCNPYFLELVRAPTGRQKRSLKELSPTLSRLLMDFKASGNNLQSHELAMGEDQMTGIYRVSFFRRGNPVYRFLIIIIPVPTINAAEKILWADTARRLSHHVRRHITNVILALPRLTDENVDVAERKEYQQIISAEVEKIRVFTHSFQRFSELRDHDLRQHDVLPLVEHVLDHLRIPEGVKLIRNIPLDPLRAFLDPIRFEEALINLLNNALDAMSEGGYLQITLKTVVPHESPNSSLTVLIEIEDSGVGIPEKYLDEIWKPFFTTKQSGTGIGLPESRKIVESMGGMLTLHSEEKVGTTVSIWLRVGESEG